MTNSALYELPEGYFYIDTAAAKEYADNAGAEIVMKQTVPVPTGEALDAWIQRIWLTGSGAQEATPGTGRGYVGHTRFIPKLTLEEQIRSAGLPTETDAEKAIASVLYKVTKPGLMPIDDHVALVRFVPSPESKTTEIVWTIKLTPSVEGSAAFADPATVAPFLQKAVSGALATLASDLGASAL